MSDIVDALLAALALPGDQVLTSDPRDMTVLLRARDISASVITV